MCPHAVKQVIGDQRGLAHLIRAYGIITHARASRGSSGVHSGGSYVSDFFMNMCQRHSLTVAVLASSMSTRALAAGERGVAAGCIATMVSQRVCYHPIT